MSIQKSFPRTARTAVLYVDARLVEWCEWSATGSVAYGSSEVEAEDEAGDALVAGEVGGARLAKLALEARRRAGGRARRYRLVLGDSILTPQLVTLPTLPRKELQRVFERRAARLSGLEGRRVLFTTRAMGKPSVDPTEHSRQQRWLFLGFDGDLVETLRQQLSERGLRTRRIVSGGLTALSEALEKAPASEGAVIVAVVGEDTISISLVEERCLLDRDAIRGRLASDPAAAAALVQEVRSYAGYWRKHSRGGTVDRVILAGALPESASLLVHALSNALPQARVLLARPENDSPQDDGETVVPERIAVHAQHRPPAPIDPDLSFPLAPKRRLAALAGSVLFLGTGALALEQYEHGLHGLEEIRSDTEDCVARVGEHDDVLRAGRRHEQELDRLASLLERNRSISRYGLSLERILEQALEAFDGRAVFEEIEVRPAESGWEDRLTLHGTVERAPGAALERLGAIVDQLEASAEFDGVRLVLPDRLHASEAGQEASVFPFSIEAVVRG